MMKFAVVVLFAYLIASVLLYALLEIYACDCRRKHARHIPTFTEKVWLALLWPLFVAQG